MNLSELRAYVANRQKAANAKAARLRRKGVEISGTKHDPRREPAKIKRYNRAQLESYAAKLNGFVSRQNAFVPGVEGVPIPANKFREATNLAKRFNKIGAAEYERVANTFIPNAGMTIAEREDIMRPKRRTRADGSAVNKPYSNVNVRSTQFPGVEELDKFIADLKRRGNKDYLPGQLKKSRKELNQMLKTIGNTDQIVWASYLTDNQLDVLWNYTDFASDISLQYEIVKAQAAGRKEEVHAAQLEDSAKEVDELIQFAIGQSPTRGTSKRKTRRK